MCTMQLTNKFHPPRDCAYAIDSIRPSLFLFFSFFLPSFLSLFHPLFLSRVLHETRKWYVSSRKVSLGIGRQIDGHDIEQRLSNINGTWWLAWRGFCKRKKKRCTEIHVFRVIRFFFCLSIFPVVPVYEKLWKSDWLPERWKFYENFFFFFLLVFVEKKLFISFRYFLEGYQKKRFQNYKHLFFEVTLTNFF